MSNPILWDHSAVAPFYKIFFSDPLYQGFYQNSGYANFGYWEQETRDGKQAAERLMEVVTQPLPETTGNILEVGCGVGASTAWLSDQFPRANITAINIDPAQVVAAKNNVPAASIHEMDAAAMEFPDKSFDAVVAIESPFHFDTRVDFFREAKRVLAPGGYLAIADILMNRNAPLVPSSNYVRGGAAGYGKLLNQTGFCEIKIQDVTSSTWRAFRSRFTEYVTSDTHLALSLAGVQALTTININSSFAVRGYVVALARS